MGWADELEQGSFRGVSFEVLNTSDTIERRVVDAEIPYRNGGEQDDLGRRSRPTTIRAVLHGPDYLARLGALQNAVDDDEPALFRHPLLGSWNARVVRLVVDHDSSTRDQCAVTMELREDGLDAELPDLFSVEAAAEALTARATAVTDAAAEESISSTALSTAVDDAGDFVDDLESQTTDLTTRFEQLRDRANAAIADIEATIDDVTSFETIDQLRRMVLDAKQIKDRAEALLPRVVERTTAAQTSLASLIGELYGDPTRAAAVEGLNRLTNPFAIPAGKAVRVYVE